MSKFNELAYDRNILCSTIKNESLGDTLIRAQRIPNEQPFAEKRYSKGETMSTKEKQLEMIANMITDITMIGVPSPVIERIVKYSADVIDLYKKEENHE